MFKPLITMYPSKRQDQHDRSFEGREGWEAIGDCNYKETWKHLVKHYRTKSYYAPRPRDSSFRDASTTRVTPSYDSNPSSSSNTPSYNSVRAHSVCATVATQVQGLSVSYTCTCIADTFDTVRPHFVVIRVARHESPINRQQFRRAPHRNLFVTRRGSYGTV